MFGGLQLSDRFFSPEWTTGSAHKLIPTEDGLYEKAKVHKCVQRLARL